MVDEFEEFKKQYGRTIVRLKTEKDTHFAPVYVNETVLEGQRITVDHATYGSLTVKWGSKNFVWDLELPERGLFNYNQHVGMFYRLPRRQWKRGLHEHTSAVEWITLPWRKDINPVLVAGLPLPFSNLTYVDALYNRHHVTWDEATKKLREYRLSEAALSNQFALTLSPFEKDSNDVLLLWYEDQAVADIDCEDHKILVRQQPFIQEITDFVQRQRVPCQVKYSAI